MQVNFPACSVFAQLSLVVVSSLRAVSYLSYFLSPYIFSACSLVVEVVCCSHKLLLLPGNWCNGISHSHVNLYLSNFTFCFTFSLTLLGLLHNLQLFQLLAFFVLLVLNQHLSTTLLLLFLNYSHYLHLLIYLPHYFFVP